MMMDTLKTVLIIDDNKINRQILNKILEQHYKTVEAENGQVGLDLLLQNLNLQPILQRRLLRFRQ